MFQKIARLEEKYDELSRLIGDAAVIARQEEWKKHVRAHADLEDIVTAFRHYRKVLEELAGAKEILAEEKDGDMRRLFAGEVQALEAERDRLEREMKILLLPKDPNDGKNAIMEIRAGTGGNEATLFANDLFKMYSRYAEKRGWRLEVLDGNFTDLGGIKEAVCIVEGKGAYGRLKYESGVHRVQRVPDTEGGGRVHTSAATVAVLPEAEEIEVDIHPNDIRVDVFCSSGPGGQSVNTTQSAVRITHLPSGIAVSCQDEKSQTKNKEKAMKVLRSRIYEKMEQEKQGGISSTRKSMVGSGDRSERVRTFNFPQGRVTEHRIGLTLHKLDAILEGHLDEIIDALIDDVQLKQLQNEVEAE